MSLLYKFGALIVILFLGFLLYIFAVIKNSKGGTMRLGLQNGACAGRWNCKNLDKECCHPMPENNNDFIDCNHYAKSLGRIK